MHAGLSSCGTELQVYSVSQSASININQRGDLGLGRPNFSSEAAESHKMSSVQERGTQVSVLGRPGGFRDAFQALSGFTTWG